MKSSERLKENMINFSENQEIKMLKIKKLKKRVN